jgi:CDP-6-deoxy-D-xylo-4-hexulose-3-dehydrase
MVREASQETVKQTYAEQNQELNPDFIFAYPAYNVRNTEIGAIIGRNQLKQLDENNRKRRANQKIFFEQLDAHRFRTDFEFQGSCSYAFNVVLRDSDLDLRDRIETALAAAGIEYRRGSSGGGNQIRQPYLSGVVGAGTWELYPEVEHIHFFGWYIGNYPDLAPEVIASLCNTLNGA